MKMVVIEKRINPEYFNKLIRNKKNAELRLADFKIKEGDILMLKEHNPKTRKLTGRLIRKKVKNLTKVYPADFNSIKEIKKYGVYFIELE